MYWEREVNGMMLVVCEEGSGEVCEYLSKDMVIQSATLKQFKCMFQEYRVSHQYILHELKDSN